VQLHTAASSFAGGFETVTTRLFLSASFFTADLIASSASIELLMERAGINVDTESEVHSACLSPVQLDRWKLKVIQAMSVFLMLRTSWMNGGQRGGGGRGLLI